MLQKFSNITKPLFVKVRALFYVLQQVKKRVLNELYQIFLTFFFGF